MYIHLSNKNNARRTISIVKSLDGFLIRQLAVKSVNLFIDRLLQ